MRGPWGRLARRDPRAACHAGVRRAVPPQEWPLAGDGRVAARRLTAYLPSGAYLAASDEPKAWQTLEGAGEVIRDPRFGEVRREGEPWDGFRELRRAYVDGAEHPGWEPRAEVAARLEAAVEDYVARVAGRPLVVASHGMVVTVWLTARIGLGGAGVVLGRPAPTRCDRGGSRGPYRHPAAAYEGVTETPSSRWRRRRQAIMPGKAQGRGNPSEAAAARAAILASATARGAAVCPGGLPERPMGAVWKTVAKASEVRILHPPPPARDPPPRQLRPPCGRGRGSSPRRPPFQRHPRAGSGWGHGHRSFRHSCP